MAYSQTDSIVLVIIDRRKRQNQPCGIRKLTAACNLSDKTIIKTIHRLEQDRRLRVIRPGPGRRHDYDILDPPTEKERLVAALHLNEPLSLNGVQQSHEGRHRE